MCTQRSEPRLALMVGAMPLMPAGTGRSSGNFSKNGIGSDVDEVECYVKSAAD